MKKIFTSSSRITIVNSFWVAAVCILISVGARAHSGHDHHHWASELYHILGSLSVVMGLSFLLYYFFSKSCQVKREKLPEDR